MNDTIAKDYDDWEGGNKIYIWNDLYFIVVLSNVDILQFQFTHWPILTVDPFTLIFMQMIWIWSPVSRA